MEEFQKNISQVLRGNVDVLSVKIAAASAENPYIKGDPLNVDSLQQVLAGMLNILDEALEGASTEMWDTYFETIIPGLIRRGRDAASFAYICGACGVCMTHVLDQYMPGHLREEGIAWFARFVSRFSAETVISSIKAQGH